MSNTKRYIHEGKNVVIFDIETTGFSATSNSLLEVAAIRIDDFPHGARSKFDTLVFNEYVPEKIVQLTGITAEMTANAPTEEQVVTDFTAFMEGAEVVVAHNGKSFDVPFVLEKGVILAENIDVFDTLKMARLLLPELKAHKMDDLCEHYGIQRGESHRALADVADLIKIYAQLSQFEEDLDSEELSKFLDERERLNGVITQLTRKIYDKNKLNGIKAQVTSTGRVIMFEDEKIEEKFNATKFRKEYLGDLSGFMVPKETFNSKIVQEKEPELYKTYTERKVIEPKITVEAYSSKLK